MAEEKAAVNWKDTIRLPKTEFPMRAGLATREPESIEKWESAGLYQQMVENREGAESFHFHDGPPYANGVIHHGHALNKILKDIVFKFRHLDGKQVKNVPGWDCHGLPIEQKVDDLLGGKKHELDVVAFRNKCREYADGFVDKQRDGFRRLMVLADWDNPYRTMSFDYEASITRALAEIIDKGFVYKGLKPVHWSWAAVTALAEAEVEYERYVAPSVYVKFELPNPPAVLADAAGGRTVSVVIWTTTPWTLPSNVAIALNPEYDYELLAIDDSDAIVLAEGLKAEVLEKCNLPGELPVLAAFKGSALVGNGPADWPKLAARHPFIDRDSLLVAADYVTLEQGTGNVHTAPGHGQEDYETGKKYDLPIIAPVDDHGKYTNEVPDYEGMHVFKANPLIAERLAESGHLLNDPKDRYPVDRYPHCWRTKTPLIFRATEQWFVNVDHEGLRQTSLNEIGETTWVPSWGENRIRSMMQSRPDWCISRQRVWGVPIPVFNCTSCNEHILDASVTHRLADLTADHGSDVWWEREPKDLVPDGFVCPNCGAPPEKFTKGRDILDVWFDSGVSWAAVMRDREGVSEKVDLYLEGSDQHRGWFHTSLLTSAAIKGEAPYKTVLTHGFVMDENGRKYSKSSPTFEPLEKMFDHWGADILRLWVSMVDYRNDIVLAPGILKQTAGAYRKIRNTMRFLIGNLEGFEPNEHGLDFDAMTDIDRWALAKTADFIDEIRAAYERYEFHIVFNKTFEFCNEHLSSVYLDVLKDRLYCESTSDVTRRASQAVLYEALRALVVAASPVLSFTCDEVWGFMQHREGDPRFVFLADFPTAGQDWRDEAAVARFEELLSMRSRVTELIEARRPKKRGQKEAGQIGSSQEAVVTLTVNESKADDVRLKAAALAEVAIVSRVDVMVGDASDPSGIDVAVEPSTEKKCPRCWNYRADVGSDSAFPNLCGRCATVIRKDFPQLV